MTLSRFSVTGFSARLGVAVVLLLAVIVPTLAVPASTTARAAPTVSAAPAAVVAPAASATVAPSEAGAAVAGAAPGSAPGRAPAAVAGAAERWTWPVDPPHELLHAFEAPPTLFAAGHRGIDLAAQPGSPVRSPADGVVSFAGIIADRPVVSIQHAGDLVSSLEPVTATVGVGERVSAGQAVGVVATGAHCDRRCVHLGARRHGQYISPMLFFGGVPRAILLPLPPAS
ncbi:M23 family metallopeptidase [Cryobacterium sp. SO2]|uniref:murein hydrolase activator EnvC family protein n=1 Tax=Cryobacterium sp. SO2 TaxID=1897060 RepID=UPI00223E1184|nr:M23 family metallopeptidase [Cryobacterium sp. SO2]WEO75898.1 M23 family metallopeptidase [Cryobacterium sp. SO2]